MANTVTWQRKVAKTVRGQRKVANTSRRQRKVANTVTGQRKVANTGTGQRKVANTGTGRTSAEGLQERPVKSKAARLGRLVGQRCRFRLIRNVTDRNKVPRQQPPAAV